MSALRILVCGSRKWTDIATVAKRIGELPDDAIVIHGGCRGADKMANDAAEARGLHSAIVYPRWERFGNSAGPLRNRAMLALEPELVIAFSLGSTGTQGVINEARRRGIAVEVIGTEAR